MKITYENGASGKGDGKGTPIKTFLVIGLVLVAGIVTIPHVAAPDAAASTDLSSYVLFALEELNFKGGNDGAGLTGNVLGGNVGVNNYDPNLGDTNPIMNVGANARFIMSNGTQLVGDSIRLGNLATVYDVLRNREFGVGWPPAINPETSQLVVRGTVYNFTTPPIIKPHSYLISDASTGQQIVNVTNGSLFSVNQSVIILDRSNSERNRILSITGNNITTYNNLTNDYEIAKNGAVQADPFGSDLLDCYDGQFNASDNASDDRTVVSPPATPPTEIPSGGFLAPGTYRDLRVQDGNTLHLCGGVYTLRRFNTGRNVNIYTCPGTILQVTGDDNPNTLDFNLGVGGYFGSENSTIESVACICYLGDDLQFGRNGESWGVIKAPNADIGLGFGFNHFGRFYARKIHSDFNDNVTAKDCTLAGQTTSITAEKTATGHAGFNYLWTIEKNVTPKNLTLFTGDSGVTQYNITVTKNASTIETAHIEGFINVTNTGSIPTEGLAIRDWIYNSTGIEMGNTTVDVSAKPVLNPGEWYWYHYRVDFDDPGQANLSETYTNNATVTIENGDPVIALNESVTLTNLTANDDWINVEDTNILNGQPGSHTNPWNFSASGSVTYNKTFSCENVGTTTNTAEIQETGQTSTVGVTVNCYELRVTKDAYTSFTRNYTWAINKSADVSALILIVNETHLVNYTVRADVNASDSDWRVDGNITIYNPAPIDVNITNISDIVSPNITATLDLSAITFPYLLSSNTTLNVSYRANLTDYTTRINTATVTIQNYNYTLEGPEPLETTNFTGNSFVDFTSANITEIDECINVSDVYPGAGGDTTEYWNNSCADDAPIIILYNRSIGPYNETGSYFFNNTASFITNDTSTEGNDTWSIKITVLSLGNFVWEDLNANGIQDAGEPGIAGVNVTLYNATGVEIGDTVTDASGLYGFINLSLNENYTVRFELPTDYLVSPQYQGTHTNDSNANETGWTAPVKLTFSGEYNDTIDAGLYRPASLGNYVWEDVNANGIQDDGEPGIADVNVTLHNCTTDEEVANTTTNESGYYLFANLMPGEYYILFEAPNGYIFSPQDQGANDTLDSDVSVTLGKTECFSLASNETNLTLDAGLYRPLISVPTLSVWGKITVMGLLGLLGISALRKRRE